MPIITTIEQQTKNARRFNIYIDDTFAFGVSEQTLLFFTLHKGMAITPQLQQKILKYDQFQKLYASGVNYISYRMRSEKEVYDKLRAKLEKSDDEISQTLQEKLVLLAIKQLKTDGYINDLQYVTYFIEETLTITLKGDKYVTIALQKKGIDPTLIAQGIQTIPEEKWFLTGKQVAQAYVNKKTNVSINDLKQKVLAHLHTRGFRLELAKKILSSLDFEHAQANEIHNALQLAYKQYDKWVNRFDSKEIWFKIQTYLFQKGFNRHNIDAAIRQLKEYYDTQNFN